MRFQVARLPVKLVARQTPTDLDRALAFRQDRDAVMRALAMPKRPVARIVEEVCRTFLVGRLDLLKADDVGLRLVEPLEQPRKPAVDAVDVIGRDLQAQWFDPWLAAVNRDIIPPVNDEQIRLRSARLLRLCLPTDPALGGRRTAACPLGAA